MVEDCENPGENVWGEETYNEELDEGIEGINRLKGIDEGVIAVGGKGGGGYK